MTPAIPAAIALDSRLRALGWTVSLEADAASVPGAGFRRARVATDFGADLCVLTVAGQERAQLSPQLYRDARRGERLVVGDWVLLMGEPGRAAIVHRLGRRSAFSRQRPGADQAAQQVIAANVDVAFIVTDTEDLNVRRIERYVALARAAPAEAVIILTKIDREADVREQITKLQSAAAGATVHPVSSSNGQGIAALVRYLTFGRTVCLLGSSGVGKSTLLNCLLGHERLKTQATRRNGRGRHTTTHRELVLLPTGALLIDNPGMREVGLLEAEDGAEEAFADIFVLAQECRFGDCGHDTEPDCAVRAAAETGELASGRLGSFRTLAHEQGPHGRSGSVAPRLGPQRRRRRGTRDCADRPPPH